jgi:hypothetical protein
MDSTFQTLQVRRIQVPCQPSGRSSHPFRTPICPLCHPFGPPRQISIIRLDEVFIPSGSHTVSRSFCASLHSSGRFSNTSGRLSILDQFSISFQVPRKGRSINRPDDVVSRPDARLLKERIAIQISSSGRLTAVVRTHVHQRRKLPIRLQPSGRLPIMVRTRALQIWKMRVEE